jgi:hypothetical protein
MAIYETLYPQGNFLDIRANAPTSTDYNIQVMEDLVRNLPGGGIRDLLAPAAAATLSLPYDAIQAATRTTEDDISRAMETAGMYGPKDIASEAYGLAFGRERPLSSAIERTIGASGPLAERINNLNLFNSAVAAEKPTVPNLSLGYNMPTFDLGTGITNTTAATNMYSPFMDNRETVNQDLIQQLIEENQAKRNLFARPNMLDIAGGITNIDLIEKNELPYSGVGNMRYTTPRTIADQNKILGQTFTDKKKSNNGIIDLALSLVIPGWGILKGLGGGKTVEKFSPGGTIKDGFYKIDDVYTPLTIANDVYDPETGKNRFDRMKDKFHITRNLLDLFGASRTGSEFKNAKNILKAQKKSGYISNFMNRPKSERNYTGPGGGDNTGGDVGNKGAADTFSNKSGMGRTGY